MPDSRQRASGNIPWGQGKGLLRAVCPALSQRASGLIPRAPTKGRRVHAQTGVVRVAQDELSDNSSGVFPELFVVCSSSLHQCSLTTNVNNHRFILHPL